MSDISRRRFIVTTAAGMTLGSSLLSDGNAAPASGGDYVCMIERMRPDGLWEPSPRLLPLAALPPHARRAHDGRWYLSSRERATLLRSDFQVKVVRVKRQRKKQVLAT
ncbi:hypothetical protein [Filomicrobium sp.]|uniref:hypothetical protein n=1 Tax=Filomicrobium sp. TaxID=2024831 RepID=UPI00258AFC03|nr:hypothetical protein [Filomicrobium sp.]MCV0370227.1 hypothetical protein [Filomicrobium sp.]